MANINLIDPNNDILKGTPFWNDPNKDDSEKNNGIPEFQDIRSFVELSMRPRNPNYIELDNGNIVNNSNVDSGEKITLTGYYTRGDKNYYSTNYTEDGRPESEGFGIKNIDITFDANKIPQVNVSFYDLRGNVLNNFNSKFAKMFQLPYPIFELRIKGGFGPIVTYRLQKTRDDISIDDTGNFTINSKFIGDRFAPLSDLPLSYLQAVPYLDNTTIDVNDNQINSFHELMISAKKLYEKLNQEINSEQEVENQKKLTELTDNLENLTNILTSLNNKEVFIKWFTEDETFKAYEEKIKTRITNYLDLTVIDTTLNTIKLKEQEPVVPPLVSKFLLEPSDYNFITGIITKNVNIQNENTKNLTYGILIKTATISVVSSNPNDTNLILPFINIINYDELNKTIISIRSQIEDKSIANGKTLTDKLSNLVKDNLGGKRLTIGDIFTLLFNDYNKLMKRIYDAGNQGFADDKRYKNGQKYDKIGFPTVIEKDNTGTGGASKLIYPGSNPLFKDWPEVKLVEDFLNAFAKAQIDSLLSDLLLSKNEDGSSKYIPINSREIYTFSNTIPPASDIISDPKNIFLSKNETQICQLIYERFLIFSNINIEITETNYTDWKNGSNEINDTTAWIKNLFGKGSVNNSDIQKGVFLTTVSSEARNIAFALMIADDKVKDYFINLNTQFTGIDYFTTNPKQPLSSTKNVLTAAPNGGTFTQGISIGLAGGRDYVTVADIKPTLINSESQSSEDIITTYMKGIHEISEKYKVTKQNIFYIEDELLEKNNTSSDYSTFNKNLGDDLYFTKGSIHSSEFNFNTLYDNSKLPVLLQIPRGILIVMAGLLNIYEQYYPNKTEFLEIPIGSKDSKFKIIKNSNFYNFLKDEWKDAYDISKGFSYNWNTIINYDAQGSFVSIDEIHIHLKTQPTTETEKKQINSYLYEKRYLSVNSKEFTTDNPGLALSYTSNDALYAQYLKQLLPILSELVKKDKKTIEDKLKGYKNQLTDNDVKLPIYKSFQVIYENYLHGVKEKDFEITKTNFQFVDRAYNDISSIAVLDIKTLLSDIQDTNVSLLTAISRLLSDNNYWFYPFQGFLTTTENYNDLFKIDYYQKIKTEPMFIAMYVGGLSSNPIAPANSTISNDGILKNAIPDDFGKKTGALNAFSVKYTGSQNQMVFSDFQHSTESLKNTDEGIRIQSEIVSNASNSLSIPKGQSLLNVYSKQSYTSTIKIPFGNMGIQPTQYYYLECIPIFEGLYIIYNVTHNINSDTQRLETTFKGYRVKKDVNPIVLSELVDFTKNNFYTQTLDKIGIPSKLTNLTPQEIQIIEKTTPKKVSGWDVTSSFLRNDKVTIHGAIDIGTDVGISIKFTYPDTILYTTSFDDGGYGNFIILRSLKDKVDFVFAHLQEFSPELKKLKQNDVIPITMIIGKTGKTGGPRTIQASFFGPHLHFEVREMGTNKKLSYLPYLNNLILGA